ncbi:MAG: D-alanine--D-alanine ligase, partial [Lentisphaerae bacterium]|nr:D-alanine--D-alanine ligase [Lentisphaerota bacterium]
MKIAILHQAVPPGAREDERDVLDQAAAVRGALQGAGHETVTLPVSLDLEALTAALRREAPARVFNLVESLGGTDRLLPMVPALLEQLGIPCTGNPADALLVTTHKLLAKQRLRQGGLPTPDWIEAGAEGELINAETQRRRGEEGADSAALSPIPLRAAETNGDWILKPVWEHASAGLAGDNLLRGVPRAQAARRLAELAGDRADAWYAERFIEGREFNVALLGRTGAEPEILPPAEILFVDFPPEKPRILDYEAKWNTASFAYTHTPRTFALPAADAPLAGRLRELARACWRLFGLGGAARVDFRVDATGRPWILEVNANPCLAPDAGFAAALREARIPYAQAILALV